MVGGKTYETLGAAITAAKAGDTIYVLKDIPEAAGIAVPLVRTLPLILAATPIP